MKPLPSMRNAATLAISRTLHNQFVGTVVLGSGHVATAEPEAMR